MTWPAVIVVAAMWATLAWVGFVEPVLERRRRERATLERCGGRVRYITDAPRFDRDPSPRPPRRAA